MQKGDKNQAHSWDIAAPFLFLNPASKNTNFQSSNEKAQN